MAITPADLPGVDEDLARRIIAVARSIAPCLGDLVDEPKSDALAILKGVIAEATSRGSLHVLSERAGTVGVSYSTVRSWFQPDDRTALHALCGGTLHEGPIGEFPEKRFVADMWPESE